MLQVKYIKLPLDKYKKLKYIVNMFVRSIANGYLGYIPLHSVKFVNKYPGTHEMQIYCTINNHIVKLAWIRVYHYRPTLVSLILEEAKLAHLSIEAHLTLELADYLTPCPKWLGSVSVLTDMKLVAHSMMYDILSVFPSRDVCYNTTTTQKNPELVCMLTGHGPDRDLKQDRDTYADSYSLAMDSDMTGIPVITTIL